MILNAEMELGARWKWNGTLSVCLIEQEVGGHVWLRETDSEGVPKAQQLLMAQGKTWA